MRRSDGSVSSRRAAPTRRMRSTTIVRGVSIRSVDDLVKAMGISGISKNQVAAFCPRGLVIDGDGATKSPTLPKFG